MITVAKVLENISHEPKIRVKAKKKRERFKINVKIAPGTKEKINYWRN